MKLYPEKLHSLEDLKRERRSLKLALAEADPMSLSSMGSTNTQTSGAKAAEAAEGKNDLLVTITDLLTSNGAADVALSLAEPLLSLLGRKAGKGIIKPVAKEVLGGYVKWKLIEIGYKTALRFIRSKQHKHKKAC